MSLAELTVALKLVVRDDGDVAVMLLPSVVTTVQVPVTVPVLPLGVTVAADDEAMPAVEREPLTKLGLTLTPKLFLIAPAN